MAEQVQGQFGYQRVQPIKTKPLGTDSYGAVYKAKCTEVPCAAIIMHQAAVQFTDPAMTVVRQEYSSLCAVRHPNIVQYLGWYQDPDSAANGVNGGGFDNSLERCPETTLLPCTSGSLL